MICENPSRGVVICVDGQPVGTGNPLPISSGGPGSNVVVTDIEDGAGNSVMDPANDAIRVNIVAGGGGATPSTTATRSSVASTTTPGTTILAANSSRLGAMIYNNSNQILFLAFGSGGTSADFSVSMTKESVIEVPFNYTGIITGVWASANGAARVTEFT